jgi:uncharacterized protein YdiU (UPF0061 family)
MTVDVGAGLFGDRVLDNSFVRDLEGLYVPWKAEPVPAPELLALNERLARELGFDPDLLRNRQGLDFLTGQSLPAGATPVAQAYAGHQFGGYSPRLGDGRALLVGELVDADGRRRDLHLKGSGRTPFARGGDGKAAVGPMLREYVIGEAMHALGIPTTRALAVVATGETVAREFPLPGAVLARIAASHLRVGTFQFAASTGDEALFGRLVDHAISRHHPDAAGADNPALALFDAVVEAQAALVARWMLVGFVHGVMNTDNMTISGETIDYGPCAFMDAYDPETVFSSIDHGGRYAYGNQPVIAQWNLARLAETLLPLFADDEQRAIDAATEVLVSFNDRFERHWRTGMRSKLGLDSASDRDDALVDELLSLMHSHRADFTSTFRLLASYLRGDRGVLDLMIEVWAARWAERALAGGRSAGEVAAAMDAVNPLYIPRNHVVEAALDAATAGDLAPFERLVDVVSRPFDERPGLDAYTRPAPPELGRYRTFCGT